MPSEYALLAKTLVGIEAIVEELDPDINLVQHIEPFAQKLVIRRYAPRRIIREASSIMGKFMNLIKVFPDDVLHIMDTVKQGKLHVEFEHTNLGGLIKSLDKLSNRISVSLIIAALTIGSSLIIQTDKGLLLFDLPVLGLIGLSIAALLGIGLLISALFSRTK
ncbi:MAG: hypothetical protein GF384_05210 [Elusimicrobia bacterium]|nr:hypothetical protein [Elusimicrobiota bacterium]MBD3412190.1 hypothetical protein [Elusimicrobiota bacterium]